MASRPLTDSELDAYDLLPRGLAQRVRIHRVRALPGGYAGITLGRRVFLTRPVPADGESSLMAHELVHVRQWSEQGLLGFAVRYLASFVWNLIRHRRWNLAYRSIGAERDARWEVIEWQRRRRSRRPGAP